MKAREFGRPGMVLAAALLGAALGGSAAAQAPAGDDEVWTATVANGAVEARPAYEARDHWSRIRTGDRVEPLATVRTGRRGRATLEQDAHRLLVRPDSEVELPLLRGRDDVPQVLQGRGSVSYEVQADLPRLEVVTPFLVAGATGAMFGVDVEDGRARIHVLAGDVVVTSRIDGSTAGLHAGESAIVEAGDSGPIEVRRTHASAARSAYRETSPTRPVSGPALPLR